MLATDSSSNLDAPSIIMTLVSIVSSGICYDVIKDRFNDSKGGHIMKKMVLIIISWLCCCGSMV